MELAQTKAKGRTVKGYASVFNYPIETVESVLFGTTTYIRPGAFGKTLQEDRDQIKPLFNHGHDPTFGEKPLGVPKVMREDAHGLYVEFELDNTSYNDDLIVSMNSGALNSMSIGFMDRTENGIDHENNVREIHDVRLYEFSLVPFPANRAATVALHSLQPLELHWDGPAAMRACSSAADFRKIAFERANDSDPDTAAHWALPHHPNPDGAPGNADPGGVGAALAALHGGRGGPPDLKNRDAAESHLTAHQASFQSAPISVSVSGDVYKWTTTTGTGPNGQPTGPSVPNVDDRITLAKADTIRHFADVAAEAERMKRDAG